MRTKRPAHRSSLEKGLPIARPRSHTAPSSFNGALIMQPVWPGQKNVRQMPIQRLLGRRHDAETALNALKTAKEAGFEHLSVHFSFFFFVHGWRQNLTNRSIRTLNENKQNKKAKPLFSNKPRKEKIPYLR